MYAMRDRLGLSVLVGMSVKSGRQPRFTPLSKTPLTSGGAELVIQRCFEQTTGKCPYPRDGEREALSEYAKLERAEADPRAAVIRHMPRLNISPLRTSRYHVHNRCMTR